MKFNFFENSVSFFPDKKVTVAPSQLKRAPACSKAPRENDSLVPRGTGLQFMQFNNPALNKKQNMTTSRLIKSIGRSPSRLALLFIPLVFACFAPLPKAHAVAPPPDGGYPGGNTAEGQNALLSLITGTYNTAIGVFSLESNTAGRFNTATGAGTLLANIADGNTATGAGVLLRNTIGTNNTANGAFALFSNSSGSGNIALGYQAGFSLTTGNNNIALGYQAGFSLTTGNNNIDIGNIGSGAESNTIRIGDPAIHAGIFVAGITAMSPEAPNQAVLMDPATGQLGSADISSFGVINTSPGNTAVGDQALVSNTGESNTATGFQALSSNTGGRENTATGAQALSANAGSDNTAVGAFALFSNQGDLLFGLGEFNNAVGANSLFSNVDGSSNNAVGESALFSNIGASGNTAIGDLALTNNDSSGNGSAMHNTAVGALALFSNVDGDSNTAVGFDALSNTTTGSNNIAFGDSAGQNVTTADNVICIGANIAGANVSNSCYIGSIFGQTSSGGTAVFINSAGKLGTVTSSRRFKEEIKAMDKASEALFALKPVTFRYKKEIDPQGIYQFGLVAEDVEAVNPELVVRDKEGKVNTVRYDAVNAMLLNEFLKEHKAFLEEQRKVQEQQATITQLKKDFGATVAQLTARLDEQASQIQKVSAQLEASNLSPQVVNNP